MGDPEKKTAVLGHFPRFLGASRRNHAQFSGPDPYPPPAVAFQVKSKPVCVT